jgi:HEAT repeat protein
VAVLAATAQAQSAGALKEARAQIAAGRAADALAALADAKTPEGLSLKVEAAARAKRFDVAASAYAALRKTSGKDDPALLHLMGREQLLVVEGSNDQIGRVAMCDALLPDAVPDGIACLENLRKWARDEAGPFTVRVAAAAALARRGDATAAALLTRLAGDKPSASSRRVVVSVLGGLPSRVAVPLLVPMLQDEDVGVQFSAASTLGEHRTPEARAALQAYLSVTDRRIARGAAELALAAQGDPAALQRLSAEVEELAGGDLYAAGLALRAAGDPKGLTALVRVAQGDNDLLKLQAAAQLVDSRPVPARAVFEAGLTRENPLIRAAAIRIFRGTDLVTPAVLLTGIADSSPEVRTEAALGLVARYPTGARAPAPPRAKRP